MTFVLVDDNSPDHPKFIKAGYAAYALFIAGLAYCNRHGTDGKIPKEAVPGLLATMPRRIRVAAATALCQNSVEIWSENGRRSDPSWTDCGSYYDVHDFLKHQPSREEVDYKKQVVRDRVQRWRETKKKDSNANGNALPARWDGDGCNAAPIPSHPIPPHIKARHSPSESASGEPTLFGPLGKPVAAAKAEKPPKAGDDASSKKPPARYLTLDKGVSMLARYPDLDNPAIREALRDFLEVNEGEGKALSAPAITEQLKSCQEMGPVRALDAIRNSARRRLPTVMEPYPERSGPGGGRREKASDPRRTSGYEEGISSGQSALPAGATIEDYRRLKHKGAAP